MNVGTGPQGPVHFGPEPADPVIDVSAPDGVGTGSGSFLSPGRPTTV